jgi:ribosome-associated heat shock protein Hsp15
MTTPQETEGVRIDRWLFAVRIFKSRSIAAKEISAGHVKVEGESVKAHRPVRLNDVIVIKREGRTYEYTVKKLLDKRVGAKDAQEAYTLVADADVEPEMREMLQLYREMNRHTPRNKGRPTKRDRRLIEKHKDHFE